MNSYTHSPLLCINKGLFYDSHAKFFSVPRKKNKKIISLHLKFSFSSNFFHFAKPFSNISLRVELFSVLRGSLSPHLGFDIIVFFSSCIMIGRHFLLSFLDFSRFLTISHLILPQIGRDFCFLPSLECFNSSVCTRS